MHAVPLFALLLLLLPHPGLAASQSVDNTAALVAAVRDGAEGATIQIAAGTYELMCYDLRKGPR